jgi:hypothetical protein
LAVSVNLIIPLVEQISVWTGRMVVAIAYLLEEAALPEENIITLPLRIAMNYFSGHIYS